MEPVLWVIGLILGAGALASANMPADEPTFATDNACKLITINDLGKARAACLAMAKGVGIHDAMPGDVAILKLLPKLVPRCKGQPTGIVFGSLEVEEWSDVLARAAMLTWAELVNTVDNFLREKAVI